MKSAAIRLWVEHLALSGRGAAQRRARGLLCLALHDQPPRRPDVRTGLAPLPDQEHADHHQPPVRRMARGLPQRRMCRLPDRPPHPQRRDRHRRRRLLPSQGGARTHRAARPPAQRCQAMTGPTKPPPAATTLWAAAVAIPTLWTPEQALAVFELLDEWRDKIWTRYGGQIQAFLSDEQRHADARAHHHDPCSDDSLF